MLSRLSMFVYRSGSMIQASKLQRHKWLNYDETHKKSLSTHRSNAEEMIHRVPVIEVESDIVRCIVGNDGGTELNAGHPQVYIMLNTRTGGQVQSCKYCGLRYQKSEHHHDHSH